MTHHYDVIIVGAGSSGCALAARLSENRSRSVLVLEAGHRYGALGKYPWSLRRANVNGASQPGSRYSWPFAARLTDEKSLSITRGKVVGGSSAVNVTLFTRGTPGDYDGWGQAGNAEWSYHKLLPSFIRQESDLDFGRTDVHGATGPIPVRRIPQDDLSPITNGFVEACLDLGQPWDPDMNAPESVGIGLMPLNSHHGLRFNAGVQYLEPALARENLTLCSDTMVNRVLFDKTRAIGVEAVKDGAVQRFHADEVVVCAGGLKTPQILMLSGVGDPAELKKLEIAPVASSPYVGKGLMDHPLMWISYMSDETFSDMSHRPNAEVGLNLAADGVDHGSVRIMSFVHSYEQQLFGTLRGNSLRERLGSVVGAPHLLSSLHGTGGATVRAWQQNRAYRAVRTLSCSLTVGESRGELRLASADPSVPPRIEYRFMSEEADRRRMREGMRLAIEIFNHRSFQNTLKPRRLAPSEQDLSSDAALDSFIRRNIATAYHSTSTCRMGPATDDTAVVDQTGRVYGVEGLRVLDISIAPTIPSRPTNATAVAIGERGAELFDRNLSDTTGAES